LPYFDAAGAAGATGPAAGGLEAVLPDVVTSAGCAAASLLQPESPRAKARQTREAARKDERDRALGMCRVCTRRQAAIAADVPAAFGRAEAPAAAAANAARAAPLLLLGCSRDIAPPRRCHGARGPLGVTHGAIPMDRTKNPL